MSNVNTTTMNAQADQGKEEKQKYRIRVTKPADFDPCEELRITTAKELSTVINSLMTPAFRDFAGSTVTTVPIANQGVQPVVYLYFEIFNAKDYGEADKDDVFAFIPLASNGNMGLVEKLTRMGNSMAGTGGAITITDDCKDALTPFVTYGNPKKIDWNSYINPIVMGGHTYVRVALLNLSSLVSEAYGRTDEEGASYDYRISIGNSITQDQNVRVASYVPNFVINIQRLKSASVNRAAELAGIVTFDNSQVPPMIRATR